MAPSTIIFGPTGGVGSAAARAVQEHGAKVFLALRDPEKPIPGLSLEQEKAGNFERVQADLTQPDTVSAAVRKTGAKRAFIYMVFGAADHMRPTVAALKSAGIEFVVFLSSFSVQGDARKIPQSDFIGYAHAQVEVVLEETFGANGYVAVRPAWFASNTLRLDPGISDGKVAVTSPDVKFDWISPADIGAVSGALLVQGADNVDRLDGPSFIYLCGPEMRSQRDVIAVIGRAIGVSVSVESATEEQGVEKLVKHHGTPEPVAKYLVSTLKKMESEGDFSGSPGYEQGVKNVQKYTGRQPTKFEEWAEQNKQLFSA